MKKMICIVSVIVFGSFAAQAQEHSDVVGTNANTTKTKVIVKKITQTDALDADQKNTNPDAVGTSNTEDRKAYATKSKTGVTTSNARVVKRETSGTTTGAKVVTLEELQAKKKAKEKKATKKDNQ